MKQKLASVQKISAIYGIEGADNIVVAKVLGWECIIAKKYNFKVGDLVVYIEVDSIVPEREEFEYLRDCKWRVRTIKLRKQVSQGLIVPRSILPDKRAYLEGEDVTDVLGITKYEKQKIEEKGLISSKHRTPVLEFLMRNKTFRTTYKWLNTKKCRNWPNWIQKTDEECIQNCANRAMRNYDKKYFITENLDGQSSTFFTYTRRVWGVPIKDFGVCSRNRWIKTPDNSNYWKIAKKYSLASKISALGKPVVIQGEILNTKVKSDKYKAIELELYVFNVVQENKRLPYDLMVQFCEKMGLKVVPLVDGEFCPAERWPDLAENSSVLVKALVALSIGKSQLINTQRKGIVLRLIDNPSVSFKVLNPKFLLKYRDN